MNTDYVAPTYESDGFNCPYCGAYAHQKWWRETYFRNATSPYTHSSEEDEYLNIIDTNMADWTFSVCAKCGNIAIWDNVNLVFPTAGSAPEHHPDMPEEVAKYYGEAKAVVGASPRSAAALLRLALQILLNHLGNSGKTLDEQVGCLVSSSQSPKLQQALDALRIIGNNAVHPGTIDIDDNYEMANSLFILLNYIVEDTIAKPKMIQSLYDSLPQQAKDHVMERDRKSN